MHGEHMQAKLLPRLALVLTVLVVAACPAAKTAAQRIDDAAAIVGKTVGTGADDVKSTLRQTMTATSDETFAASLERMAAAKPTWTSKAWSAAKATVEVARSEPVSLAAQLVCEGLERWENGQRVSESDIELWAIQLTGLAAEDPVVQSAVDTTTFSLNYHGQGDLEYLEWVRGTACFVDAIP